MVDVMNAISPPTKEATRMGRKTLATVLAISRVHISQFPFSRMGRREPEGVGWVGEVEVVCV